MLSRLLLLLLIFPSISYTQESPEDSLGGELESENIVPIELSISNLQGLWKRNDRSKECPCGGEVGDENDRCYRNHWEYGQILFEGEKMYYLDYPIRLDSVIDYKIKDGRIVKINASKRIPSNSTTPPLPPGVPPPPPLPSYVYFGGCEIIYPKCSSILSKTKKGIKLCFENHSYSKNSLNSKLIQKLKSGQFNSGCFVGKWVLVKGYDSKYGDNGDVSYKYPWSIPDTLNITPSRINRFWDGQYLYLYVNGEKKAFSVHIKFHDEYGTLLLSPTNWYKRRLSEDDIFYENALFVEDGIKYRLNYEDVWE